MKVLLDHQQLSQLFVLKELFFYLDAWIVVKSVRRVQNNRSERRS